MRVGHGFDVHRLVEGRPCIIGGVSIPFAMGLLGHSDADVLLHAIADALLGAAGLGDIGRWVALRGIPVYVIFLVYVVQDRRKEDAARAAQRAGARARDAGSPQ